MNIKLKITHILPKKSGEGRNGTWQKQEFVGETDGQYPKQMKFDLWGDRTNHLLGKKVGQEVEVHFDAESREWEGKWYTDLRAWKVVATGEVPESPGQVVTKADDVSAPVESATETEEELPF